MKRLGIVLATAMLVVGFSTSPAQAVHVTNPAAAPSGTHLVTGTAHPACTVSGLTVTCNSYELAGVGNTNATAAITASYTATVDCRNHGGKIVEVHADFTSATATTGQLEPKNGRLLVPSISTAGVLPTEEEFEEQATCPNPNWTAEIRTGSVALTGFTYTLSFTGFSGAYITITG